MLLKSFGWNGFSSIANGVIQMLQLVTVAAFLTPVEFGTMAIAQIFLGIGYLLMDSGFSNLLIQRNRLSENQKCTILIAGYLTSLLIFTFLLFLSPFITDIFDSELLETVINTAAYVFLISSVVQYFHAVSQKALRFSLLAKAEVTATLFGFIVVFYCCYMGHGVLSLVYGLLTVHMTKLVLFAYGNIDLLPKRFAFDAAFIKGNYRFGLYQLGERFVSLLASQADTIIIGKLLGAHDLGVYTLARNVVLKTAQLFQSVISKTCLPLFSKNQDETVLLKELYRKILFMLLPVLVSLFFSFSLFFTFIGVVDIKPSWKESAQLFPVFCYISIPVVMSYLMYSAVLSKGKVKQLFYLNIITLVVNSTGVYFFSEQGLVSIVYFLFYSNVIVTSILYGVLISKNKFMPIKEHFVITTVSSFFAPVFVYIISYFFDTYSIM